ncbi:hypothetical protein CSUB01_06992 [Colletotrichum sublineola]|uniref:Uncharacterized protein n=1 Tax=Colletotrichum sublineola TaxID=1173701 RepID=A0A066X2J3_COLSU|nr:hypothetical protein CSUB01_06992 [Colletotrichum sublineola]
MDTAPVTLSDMYGIFHDAVARHYQETGESAYSQPMASLFPYRHTCNAVTYTYINVVRAYVDWLMCKYLNPPLTYTVIDSRPWTGWRECVLARLNGRPLPPFPED